MRPAWPAVTRSRARARAGSLRSCRSSSRLQRHAGQRRPGPADGDAGHHADQEQVERRWRCRGQRSRCQAEATCWWARRVDGEGQAQGDGGQRWAAAATRRGGPGGGRPDGRPGSGERRPGRRASPARPASRLRRPGRLARSPASAGSTSQIRCWPRGLSAGLRGSLKRASGSSRWPGSTRTIRGPAPVSIVQLGGQGQLGARAALDQRRRPRDPRPPGRPGCRAGRRTRRPGPRGELRDRGDQPGVGGQGRPGGRRRPLASSSTQPPLKISTPGPVQASMAWATSVAASVDAGGGVLGQVQLADDEDPAADRDGQRRPRRVASPQ